MMKFQIWQVARCYQVLGHEWKFGQ